MLDGQWINMASRQTRLFERYKNLDVGRKTVLLTNEQPIRWKNWNR